MTAAVYAGLDLLATAVVVLDGELRVRALNAAAQGLFGLTPRAAIGHRIDELFEQNAHPPNDAPEGDSSRAFFERLRRARAEDRGFYDPLVTLARPGGEALPLSCLATPIETGAGELLLELRKIDQQLRLARESLRQSQSAASRELIRNLAHEIKNPLGGLRGSAQLLERELDRPALREYTQVIIREADRLQSLMERLLTPHRVPKPSRVSIHEVCERVRSLVLAEFPRDLAIRRDYDPSLPDLIGDPEQLIQAVLNIVRNAAQALAAPTRQGATDAMGAPGAIGEIRLRTRVAHQVMISGARKKLALELQVVDDGPGIPVSIRDRIFYPLVSGRDGGSGLGLTLAQTFVQYHHGAIECESEPGRTVFRILLPLDSPPTRVIDGAAKFSID